MKAEIENKFLSIIDEVSSKKRDVVDSFLDQLGDILRRLPYVRRRNLQRRLMDIAIEQEDAELEKRCQIDTFFFNIINCSIRVICKL